ncbi:MAG: hypothetical protein ACRD5G_05585 [Candidatus Acidiferrales bacterium]
MSRHSRRLFLDTSLWNELLDRAVDPAELLRRLRARGIQLVINTQLIFELAKGFRATRPQSIEKAKALFKYLSAFTSDRSVPCLQMNSDQLREEARRAHGEIERPAIFLNAKNYERMSNEVAKLAAGDFDKRADEFIRTRRSSAQNFREEIVGFLSERPALVAEMKQHDFSTAIRKSEQFRAAMLTWHMHHDMPTLNVAELRILARRMAKAAKYRAANAIVRADLYVNWRAARGGALARDVQDDCYHLVSAAYCDIFATKDTQQATYAREILAQTRVAAYDGACHLVDWLESL